MINEQLEAQALAERKDYGKHITFVDNTTYEDTISNLIKTTELMCSNVQNNVELGFILMLQVLPEHVYSAIAEIVNTQLIHNRYEDRILLIAHTENRNDLHNEHTFENFVKQDSYQEMIPCIHIELSHINYKAKCFGGDCKSVLFEEYIVLTMQIYIRTDNGFYEYEIYYPLLYHFNCKDTTDEPGFTDEVFSCNTSVELNTDVRFAITKAIASSIDDDVSVEIKILPFNYNINQSTVEMHPYTLEILNQITLY